MKRLIALACTGALLTACAHTSPQMAEGKTIAGLWSSLKFAAETADVAVKAGQLKGPGAATVASDLRNATKVISDADAAYRANPSADLTAAIVEASTILTDVLCIAKPTPACIVSPT